MKIKEGFKNTSTSIDDYCVNFGSLINQAFSPLSKIFEAIENVILFDEGNQFFSFSFTEAFIHLGNLGENFVCFYSLWLSLYKV